MRIVTTPFAYCKPTIRILQACNSHIVFSPSHILFLPHPEHFWSRFLIITYRLNAYTASDRHIALFSPLQNIFLTRANKK